MLFGPPDQLVRNFTDREPRWLIQWTLFCWPGIAVHYGIRQLPHPGIWAYFKDETEHTIRCGLHFEFSRPRWRSKKLRKYSFFVQRSPDPRPIPSPAQLDTVSEPSNSQTAAVTHFHIDPDNTPIYKLDPDTLLQVHPMELSRNLLGQHFRVCQVEKAGAESTLLERDETIRILEDRLESCQVEKAGAESALLERDETIRILEDRLESCQVENTRAESALSERDKTVRILEDRLESCQEERDDTVRELKNREKMLTLLVERRTDLMEYISRKIQNTGEYVRPLLRRITMHDLSTISDFLRAQDEAIKRRDGNLEPDLATCCASIMAEPATLTCCASILAGVQAEKECLEDANYNLFLRVLMWRRTLFALRKRTWTVAIVRDVGDMMASQEPPPLTDFFSIDKGDDTHLVCRSVAGIPTSSSISFKSYVVDDVLIAQSNSMIEGILTTLIYRVLGKHDVCFIADGQSGSGKSYTLFNGPDALAPWISRDILNKEYRYEATIKCTALEVSQDGLRDLLGAEGSPATGPPQSQSPRGKKSQALVNPQSELITSEAQLRHLLTQACQRRRVSATGANAVSSRGHMICTLTIELKTPAGPESTRVVIVDLAGSERRQNESLTDDEKAETKFINNSRTEVRRALICLANNEIPPKESIVRETAIDGGRLPADLFS